MTGAGIRASMAGVEQRLARLRQALLSGELEQLPAFDQATEDLSVSLEELHVALEELETTNEELATSKIIAEEEGRRYQELFRLTPAACLVTDTKGVIQEANQAAEALFGRSARGLVDKPLSAFVVMSDQGRFFQFLDTIQGGGNAADEECELRMRGPNKHEFIAGVAAVPGLDLQGRTTGARWLLRDLTHQLQKERDRREAGDREAYRHISGGVIHHLNNLLGSIRGNAELIDGNVETGEKVRRAARKIYEATERGERLTSQLLAFARVGRQQCEAQQVNLLVREACEMGSQLLPEDACVVTDLSPGAGAFTGDGIGLYQAILNLILNARDALVSGGEIRVATKTLEIDEPVAAELDVRPGPYVAISVTDSGSGMDAETRARAPEPFFSTKAIGNGFGLGLSTAEAIVREAAGALELRSDLGTGTVATLYLPRT